MSDPSFQPPIMVTNAPTPVLPATKSRLNWRAVASWLQAVGATLTALVIAISQNQAVIAPLVPIKYASIGAVIFAVGKILEASQHQQDIGNTTGVNFSLPVADTRTIHDNGENGVVH